MMKTTGSVRQRGLLVLVIARPDTGDGYALSGHRRRQSIGLDDDAATITIVDGYLRRKSLFLRETLKAMWHPGERMD